MRQNVMKRSFIIFFVAVLLLVSCGSNDELESDKKQETVTLILAVFDDNTELRRQVEIFNEEHEPYHIEIQKYERSEKPEEDGLLRLQREIASGEGPDVIDYGGYYATSDIVGRYTENLFSYLEKEETGDYFSNVINAFSYKEGLYAVPLSFKLETFAGSREVVGDRGHWNIQEMIECYQGQDQDVMLYPGQTKKDVFGTILTGSLEYYIDWETGICKFDGTEFQKVLEFCNTFPDSLNITNDFSVKKTFLEGKTLLLNIRLSDVYDISKAGHIFNEEEITYIGYPVDGVCGTVIKPSGSVMAISRNSKYKDISWQFIYQCLGNICQKEIVSGFPICRSALEEKILDGQQIEYTLDSEGNEIPIVKQQILFEGEEPIDIYAITEEQGKELLKLIETAEISTTTDYELYQILLEEADSYFSGDKGIEEVVNVMQSRASIYISERIN